MFMPASSCICQLKSNKTTAGPYSILHASKLGNAEKCPMDLATLLMLRSGKLGPVPCQSTWRDLPNTLRLLKTARITALLRGLFALFLYQNGFPCILIKILVFLTFTFCQLTCLMFVIKALSEECDFCRSIWWNHGIGECRKNYAQLFSHTRCLVFQCPDLSFHGCQTKECCFQQQHIQCAMSSQRTGHGLCAIEKWVGVVRGAVIESLQRAKRVINATNSGSCPLPSL